MEKVKTRVCNKCKKTFPATLEFFHKHNQGKFGLRASCKECLNKSNKKYRDNNSEKELIRGKKYYNENIEQRTIYFKNYRKDNKEKINKYFKENKNKLKKYRQKNKELMKRYNQTYRTKKRQLPNDLTLKQWSEIRVKFNNKCAYCRRELSLEQEHFIPLSKGGEYTINNIIPACKSCNSSKRNKDFFGWYPQQEFYSKERELFVLKHLGYKKDEQQLKII